MVDLLTISLDEVVEKINTLEGIIKQLQLKIQVLMQFAEMDEEELEEQCRDFHSGDDDLEDDDFLSR